MGLVDSHCHLDDSKFDADRDEVIDRARAAGVERMMAIGTGDGPADLRTAIRQAERYAFIYATIGVHPHDAAKAVPETFAELRELAKHPKVLAVGEIGLDYHYDFSPREVQRMVFEKQLEIAAGEREAHCDPHARGLARHARDSAGAVAGCGHHALFHRRRRAGEGSARHWVST